MVRSLLFSLLRENLHYSPSHASIPTSLLIVYLFSQVVCKGLHVSFYRQPFRNQELAKFQMDKVKESLKKYTLSVEKLCLLWEGLAKRATKSMCEIETLSEQLLAATNISGDAPMICEQFPDLHTHLIYQIFVALEKELELLNCIVYATLKIALLSLDFRDGLSVKNLRNAFFEPSDLKAHIQ
ncbi:hypothetical protein FOCC_FOCC014794, partial [Frankliniella occidentalis]